MNPRDTQEQIGLFRDFPYAKAPNASEIETIRAEAMQARDAAIAAGLRKVFAGVGHAFAALGAAVVTWPQRRATYESLRSLTDRELADIGLTRGEISKVFEPEFRAPAKPANRNVRALPSRAQIA